MIGSRLRMLVRPRAAWWLALLAWCTVIFVLSAQPHLELSERELLDLVVRKLGHAAEYAVLVLLASMTFAQEGLAPRTSRRVALAFAVLYASSDEWHQTFVAGRSGRPRDVAIDAVGALIAAWWIGRRPGRLVQSSPGGNTLRMPTTAANDPLHVRLEGALWEPGRMWQEAVQHLASRFARVRPLDARSVPDPGPDGSLDAAVAAIEAWAGDDIDWSRELTRWLDEHASLHLRPDPSISRALRALGTHRQLIAVSALPDGAVSAILRHAGLDRAFRQGQRAREDAVLDRRSLERVLAASQ